MVVISHKIMLVFAVFLSFDLIDLFLLICQVQKKII
jgi:hypothetical protein